MKWVIIMELLVIDVGIIILGITCIYCLLKLSDLEDRLELLEYEIFEVIDYGSNSKKA